VLLRLFQTSRQFNVEIQPQLVLLQKTLLNVEGLGRELDPELDLWKTAKPFLERWMSEQLGWLALENNIKREAANWAAPAADPAAPGAPGTDRHRDAGAQPGTGKPGRRDARCASCSGWRLAVAPARWRSRSCDNAGAVRRAKRPRPGIYTSGPCVSLMTHDRLTRIPDAALVRRALSDGVGRHRPVRRDPRP
jgi:hypothetical protein